MKKSLRQLARKLSTRMQGFNYLHRGVVLALDLICSTIAGALAILITGALLDLPLPQGCMLGGTAIVTAYSACVFMVFRFYKVIIRHASLRSLPRIIVALGIIACAVGASTYFAAGNHHALLPIVLAASYFFLACALIIGLRIAMVGIYYTILSAAQGRDHHSKKVFIYGHVEKAASLATYIKEAYRGTYLPAAIIDPDTDASQLTISELRVYAATTSTPCRRTSPPTCPTPSSSCPVPPCSARASVWPTGVQPPAYRSTSSPRWTA